MDLPNSLYRIEPLLPAYGRKYISAADAQKDFDANKDFRTPLGQYINKTQLVPILKNIGLNKIMVRLNRDYQMALTIGD